MKLSDRLAAAQQRPSDTDRQPGGAHRAAARRRAAAEALAAGAPTAVDTTAPADADADVAVDASADADAVDAAGDAAGETGATPAAEAAAGEPAEQPAEPAARPATRSRKITRFTPKAGSAKQAVEQEAAEQTAAEQKAAEQKAADPEAADPEVADPAADPLAGEDAAAAAALHWVTISDGPADVAPEEATGADGPGADRPDTDPTAGETPAAGPAAVPIGEPATPGERVRYIDPLGGIKRKVHQQLLEALGPTLYDAELDERELAVKVRQTLQQVMASEQTLISTAERVRIINEVSDEILGHGPLEPFLRNPEVTEIMVNGADQIYVERGGQIYPVNASFSDDAHLQIGRAHV